MTFKAWVGDPCYHKQIGDDEDASWDKILNLTNYFEDSDVVIVGGRKIAGHHTEYGDGVYSSNFADQKYPVDSGTIGFVEWKEGDKTPFGMFLHEFSEIPSIKYDGGTIFIGYIMIETGDEPDEECEYDNEEYDDEGYAYDD